MRVMVGGWCRGSQGYDGILLGIFLGLGQCSLTWVATVTGLG